MTSSLLRQWHVLSMLPRAPRQIDTRSIERRLREQGFAVHRRTIQRDLMELSEVFPIAANERARPYGWRWSSEATTPFEFPLPSRIAGREAGTSGDAATLAVSLRLRRLLVPIVASRLGGESVRVADQGDGFAALRMLVPNSTLTRRLLLGLSDEVEVLEPLGLRLDIAARARLALRVHERPPG